MATPGTPSGENHSPDSQKCGSKVVMPRAASSACSGATRGSSALPSIVTFKSAIRRSSSLASGQEAHSGSATVVRAPASQCNEGGEDLRKAVVEGLVGAVIYPYG